ncbi:homogentisate geranylgeranyltransferase, chloroplastic-like [Silene latifolia]|uniref:homogentisate geranylgeranyltransferase, chloroplastic-like n=1 Tax=Silene latifolia TaxID=37657 RepID=UPI003D76C32F
MYGAENLLHPHIKSVYVNSLRRCDIFENGCRISSLNIPDCRWSIQSRQICCRISSRSCHKQFIKAKIIVNNNPIILENKQLVKRRVLRRLSRPFTPEASFTNDDDKFSSFFNHIPKQLDVFYRFSRPHTIIGTLIGVTSVSLLPLESMSDLSHKFFMGWLKTLVPAILMNIYVVGLNQLFDIEIDKVNKPNLPLASGEFTMTVASTIVFICCISSFAIGFASQSPPLIMALLICFFLGSAYSVDLPLLRWKKQPFLAASCIVIVRAMTLQVAFFIHVQRYVLGKTITLTQPVIIATSFMCFFVTVIALFKDIPDIDGDRNFGIQSFSVSLGKEKVFWLCIKLLLVAYGSVVALGATSPSSLTNIITIFGHSILALILWVRAQYVNLNDNVSITSFYMFIWKLFYAEYFLIPFVR